MSKVLFNFKKLELKGTDYEDLDLTQIKTLLWYYNIIIGNPKFEEKKEIVIEHFKELLSLYQGNIISKIDSLSKEFNVNFVQSTLFFDEIFRKRKQNKNKLSYLDILAPIETDENTLKNQLLLDKVIDEMIEEIRNNKEWYIQMVMSLEEREKVN